MDRLSVWIAGLDRWQRRTVYGLLHFVLAVVLAAIWFSVDFCGEGQSLGNSLLGGIAIGVLVSAVSLLARLRQRR